MLGPICVEPKRFRSRRKAATWNMSSVYGAETSNLNRGKVRKTAGASPRVEFCCQRCYQHAGNLLLKELKEIADV